MSIMATGFGGAGAALIMEEIDAAALLEQSKEHTEPDTEHATEKAMLLVLVAGIIATLQGVGVQVAIQHYGFRWSSITMQTGLGGALLFGLLLKLSRKPFMVDDKKLGVMLKRGFLGGVASACACYAISVLPLGVANCIMFTMPLWTSVLSYVKLGKPWSKIDLLIAGFSMGGTVIVCEVWTVWRDAAQYTGVLAAIFFAIVNADAVLVS